MKKSFLTSHIDLLRVLHLITVSFCLLALLYQPNEASLHLHVQSL